MEIINVFPLVEIIPSIFSPTSINSMLKCPLRGRFDNSANDSYKSSPSAKDATLGNVIHAVFKDLKDKTRTGLGFDQLWDVYETQECSEGLKEKVRNLGRMKYLARLQANNMNQRATSKSRNAAFYIQTEQMLNDVETGIKGKPDVMIFKDLRPFEIKDYKTGQVIEEMTTVDEETAISTFERVKSDYKNQLYFYAYLANSTYGFYPEFLTIIPPDGHEIKTNFVLDFMKQLLNDFFSCQSRLYSLSSEELAISSDSNCRYCPFKAGCNWCYRNDESPITDLSGTVEQSRVYSYGNFALTLGDGKKFFYQSPTNICSRTISDLEGKEVFICHVRKQDPQIDLYLPTRISRLYVKGMAA